MVGAKHIKYAFCNLTSCEWLIDDSNVNDFPPSDMAVLSPENLKVGSVCVHVCIGYIFQVYLEYFGYNCSIISFDREKQYSCSMSNSKMVVVMFWLQLFNFVLTGFFLYYHVIV